MIRARDGLQMIADAISRKPDIAAILVPKQVALALVDEMYPSPPRHNLDMVDEALDLAVDKAREKYIKVVSKGGYIGTLMSVPVVVADDVIICPLSKQELRDCAGRFGVNLAELDRDLRRGAA